MSYAQENEPEDPPHLRRLRRMVMALMVVLMAGIVTIAATIVIRLGFAGDEAAPVQAAQFAPPPGEVEAVGRGEGTVLMVIRGADGARILAVFDQRTGGAPPSISTLDPDDATAPAQ